MRFGVFILGGVAVISAQGCAEKQIGGGAVGPRRAGSDRERRLETCLHANQGRLGIPRTDEALEDMVEEVSRQCAYFAVIGANPVLVTDALMTELGVPAAETEGLIERGKRELEPARQFSVDLKRVFDGLDSAIEAECRERGVSNCRDLAVITAEAPGLFSIVLERWLTPAVTESRFASIRGFSDTIAELRRIVKGLDEGRRREPLGKEEFEDKQWAWFFDFRDDVAAAGQVSEAQQRLLVECAAEVATGELANLRPKIPSFERVYDEIAGVAIMCATRAALGQAIDDDNEWVERSGRDQLAVVRMYPAAALALRNLRNLMMGLEAMKYDAMARWRVLPEAEAEAAVVETLRQGFARLRPNPLFPEVADAVAGWIADSSAFVDGITQDDLGA